VAVAAAHVIDEDADEVEWLVPRKYADFRTSDIAVQIDGPQDELVVDLTWDDVEPPGAAERDADAAETSNNVPDEHEASSE
jgi:hypothetical protein